MCGMQGLESSVVIHPHEVKLMWLNRVESIEVQGGSCHHVTPIHATQHHILALLKLPDGLYKRSQVQGRTQIRTLFLRMISRVINFKLA